KRAMRECRRAFVRRDDVRAGRERSPYMTDGRLPSGDIERRRFDDDESAAAGGRRAPPEGVTKERCRWTTRADRFAGLGTPCQRERVGTVRVVDAAMRSRGDADDARLEILAASEPRAQLVDQPDEAPPDMAEANQHEIERHTVTLPMLTSRSCSRFKPSPR